MSSETDDNNRTPLGDTSGNKTVVAVVNPYLTNRAKKQPPPPPSPQQQQQQQQVVIPPDENNTGSSSDNNSKQPNDESSLSESQPIAATATATATAPLRQQASNDTTTDSSHDAIQLLSALQRDYEELQKTSVKSCLRSKHFPCPEVSCLLEKDHHSSSTLPSLSLELLQSALQTLLQHPDHLGSFQDQTHPKPSLWYMTRLGTAIRLLQLLLVVREYDAQAKTKLILGLLQSITTTVKDSLQNWRNNNKQSDKNYSQDDDEQGDLYKGRISESYHAPQVATFAFACLLRTKTLFLNHRPDLLCALWKSLESLSEPIAPQLSTELLQDAMQGLCGILKDFLQQLVCVLAIQPTGTDNAPPTTPTTMHPQQLKLASFFMARLASFVKFSFNNNDEHNLEDSVLKEITSLLLCLRGISKSEITSSNNNNNNNNATKQLDSYWKVAGKVEKCLVSILTVQTKQDQSNDSTSGLRYSNVKLLLGMRYNPPNKDVPSREESTLLLLKDAFYIGKLESLAQTLLQILQQTHTDAEPERIPALWIQETNVNLVLAICEHLLFNCLPMCNHHFTSQALQCASTDYSVLDQLLDSCLRCVSDALFQCETLAPCMTSNADRGIASLHRLLLRWLMPVKNNKHPTIHHPLTRECLLAVVQFHAIRLSQMSQASYLSFVALLVNVFFDARTITCHRSTLAAALRNLLASQSSPTLIQPLRECISSEYEKKRSLKFDAGKRKRDSQGKVKKDDQSLQSSWGTMTLEDVRIIGSVMALLPTSSIPNVAVDIERFFLEVIPFDQKKRRPRKLSRNTARVTILVLAFLEAVVRENPASSSQNLFGGKSVVEAQHAIIAWFLSCWNKEFANGKRKHVEQKQLTKLSSVGRALLHLVDYDRKRTAASEAGDSVPMTEQQMTGVFQFLQLCTGQLHQIRSSLSLSSKSSLVKDAITWPYSDTEESSTRLVWEALGLLGIVAKHFPMSNADNIFQGLVEIYQNLLGPDTCWSFQAHTIGSLHAFSHSLPAAQRHLLPSCIRKKKHKSLLQCRIQGFAFEYEKSNQKDSSKKKSSKRMFSSITSLLHRCSRDLEQWSGSESTTTLAALLANGGAISKAESLTISVGSYFLTMPTQDGRKAIVIFPSEESSLEDIRFMMGPGEDDGEAGSSQLAAPSGVQRLCHAMVSESGSCKLLLKPP